MSKEVAAKAVDPFFTTKEPGRGTGLGLSQVYGLMKTYRGHLRIDSKPGAGTTITLFIPKSHEDEANEDGAHILPMPRASDGECVLVVEDQPEVLSLATEALTGLGYRVISAGNAQEALSILRQDVRVDVLFSDVVMPGPINGALLAVEARRLRPAVKVVLTSGYSGDLLRARGLPAGTEILPKPYRVEDLAKHLSIVRSR
jgi:CheY-like chemotaxis protein